MGQAATAEAAVTDTWAERGSSWLRSHPLALVLIAVPLAPLVFLGYGTDVDTWNVRESAASIRSGHYVISRPPGAPVHEGAVALLDRVGGSLATNIGSLVAAVVVVFVLASLLRRAGARHAELAALAVVANPFFIVAATSLNDSLWALAFALCGLDAKQRRRPWLAGMLWGLAIGCRMATILLVIAALAAEGIVSRRIARASLLAGAVAAVVGTVLFVPPWLSVGRSTAFLENSFGSPSALGLVGRWALKQMLFIGPLAVVVFVAGWRSFVDATRRWRTNDLLAFAVVGLVLEEMLFFRLPWKFAHLLPLLVCAVVVYALAPRIRPEWFLLLAASQLLWGFVGVRTVVPNARDRATSIKVDVALVGGPLLTDIRCRADDPGTPPPRTAEQEYDHAVAQYRCAGEWAYGNEVDVPDSSP